MPYKNRRKGLYTTRIETSGSLVSTGSATFGSTGHAIQTIMHGSVTFAVPQFTASGTTVETTAVVSNLPNGAKVWLMPNTTTGGSGIFAVAAKVASASTISASFGIANHAATGGACNVSFNYLAVY